MASRVPVGENIGRENIKNIVQNIVPDTFSPHVVNRRIASTLTNKAVRPIERYAITKTPNLDKFNLLPPNAGGLSGYRLTAICGRTRTPPTVDYKRPDPKAPSRQDRQMPNPLPFALIKVQS